VRRGIHVHIINLTPNEIIKACNMCAMNRIKLRKEEERKTESK